MLFSRDYTGIPVIDAVNGKEIGRVREWLLDRRGEAVLAFVVEGSGWLPKKNILDFKSVLNLGEDAVLVKQQDMSDALAEQETCSVLGKRVLTTSGEELGVVEDILFDPSTGKVTGLRLSSGLIDDLLSGRQVLEKKPLLSIEDDVLIMN